MLKTHVGLKKNDFDSDTRLRIAYGHFIKCLLNNKISYQGGDSDTMDSLLDRDKYDELYDQLWKYCRKFKIDQNKWPYYITSMLFYLALKMTLPFRDSCISQSYLDKNNFFARIGLAHLEGIQNNIVNEGTQEPFCFFHIYTKSFKSYQINAQQLIDIDLAFLKRARSNQLNTPLGLIVIDASKKTDEEVIEIICKEIENKRKLLATSVKNPPTARQKISGFFYCTRKMETKDDEIVSKIKCVI